MSQFFHADRSIDRKTAIQSRRDTNSDSHSYRQTGKNKQKQVDGYVYIYIYIYNYIYRKATSWTNRIDRQADRQTNTQIVIPTYQRSDNHDRHPQRQIKLSSKQISHHTDKQTSIY